jgi:copper chaperone CopZ
MLQFFSIKKYANMKTIIISLGLIIFSSFGVQAQAQFTKAELQASGLTCSLCSNAINKALKTLPFVESVQTDLNKNLFTVAFRAGQTPDIDAISKKVEDAGFSVAKFWLIGDFKSLSVKTESHAAVNGMNLHFMAVKPQVLNGSQRLQVIDKHFVLAKDFKKFSTETKMPCYQTGTMSDCCKPFQASGNNNRIYHVTI